MQTKAEYLQKLSEIVSRRSEDWNKRKEEIAQEVEHVETFLNGLKKSKVAIEAMDEATFQELQPALTFR